MNPREQAILAGYAPGWRGIELLTNPDTAIAHSKSSRYGGSGLEVEGVSYWFATTTKGIELSRHIGDRASEVLKWTTISRYSKTIPTELRDRMVDYVGRARTQSRGFKPFYATAPAMKDGNMVDRVEYDRQMAVIAADNEQWTVDGKIIAAEGAALLAEVLPLATPEAAAADNDRRLAAAVGL